MIDKFKQKYNLSFLEKLISNPSINVYVFGGAIRDIFLNREWKEIDLRIVYNKSREEREDEIEELLNDYNLSDKSQIDELNLTVYRFLPKDSNTDIPIDLSLVPDIEDNLPDFTINSIFYDLREEKIIDKYYGQLDLEKKIIRTIKSPDIQFKEEPHMIFRAIKFSCQLGFTIEPNTFQAIIDNKKEVKKTFNFIKFNKKGILVELFLGNMFKGLKDDPIKYFNYLNDLGLFEEFINFYAQESGYEIVKNNKIEVKNFGSYEKNISHLLSSVVDAFDFNDKSSHFNNLAKLLSISTPKEYSDFLINSNSLNYF